MCSILGAVQLLLRDLESDWHCQLPVLVFVVVTQLQVTLVVDLELIIMDDELFGVNCSSYVINGGDIAVEGMA